MEHRVFLTGISQLDQELIQTPLSPITSIVSVDGVISDPLVFNILKVAALGVL